MKILRNIGKIIGSTIFALALSALVLMVGLTQLTEYNKLKGLATGIIAAQISRSMDERTLDQSYQMFSEECKKSEKIQLSNFIAGQNITIECEDIRKTTSEGLVNLFGSSLFDNIYYKKFDCGFIECLQKPDKEIDVLISSEAHSFFKNSQNILLTVSGVGLIITLVSIETWKNRLKAVGINLLFISLPFFVLILLKDRIVQIPANIGAIVTPTIDQFLNSMFSILLIMLIVGIVLTIGGYVLQFMERKKVKK